MPCDAIAVAKGQIPLDLARELDGLGTEAVAQVLPALLRQRSVCLGQPELTPLRDTHSGNWTHQTRAIRELIRQISAAA